MAIDSNVLRQIQNPTMGGLSQIGQTISKERQMAYENKRRDDENKRQQQAHQHQMNDLGSQAGLAYADSMIQWDDEYWNIGNPNTTKTINREDPEYKEAFAQAQEEAWGEVPQGLQSAVPKEYQTRDQLEKGQVHMGNIQKYYHPERYEEDEKDKFGPLEKIDGLPFYGQKNKETGKYENLKTDTNGTPVGTSEFERVLNHSLKTGQITKARYNELVKQRAEGFAGEMTNKDTTKLNEKQRAAKLTESSALRDEYQEGVSHFSDIDQNINEAYTALDSGDTGLSDVMLNRVLSQVQDDNIRAYTAMQQFDKPFGNVVNRVAEGIERFVSGKRSDEEKAEIRSTLKYFQESYAQPKQKAMRDRYRAMAVDNGHDPFSVVPPLGGMPGAEEIRDSKLIDNKRKKELIMLHYPEMFK